MGVENLNKNKCLTVPNILSLIRIMLVVAFCVCYFNERLKTASLYILLLSGLTDMMDGYIARKYNQVSNLGKVLDPFADKLFTVSTIICFCINGIVPVWIAVIIFAKELFMLVGGSVLYKKTKAVIPSKWYGKVTTMLFFMTFILALVLEMCIRERHKRSLLLHKFYFIRKSVYCQYTTGLSFRRIILIRQICCVYYPQLSKNAQNIRNPVPF